jgi:gamma-glutamyltranspeptidase/glutathione hydrolase
MPAASTLGAELIPTLHMMTACRRRSALFTRIALSGVHPQEAISAPRRQLGRNWGRPSETLKLERRFPHELFDALKSRGHDLEWIGDMDETAGHAGAPIRHSDGTMIGGCDPKSDGAVAGF